FWIGDASAGERPALEPAMQRWFGGDKALDMRIRERFGEQIESALAGGFRQWEDDIRARLALIILLDQFTRNVFRGTARAFAGDARALGLARGAIAAGDIQSLTIIERVFLFMPCQHAEDRKVQDESVRLFAALAEEAPVALEDLLRTNLKYAKLHHDIVMRFGRFPHRNAVLKRTTTPDEAAWLEESGMRFGQ
ncbi:MAG TPA: DUF924 family protein, partial [Gammaproteobacteria bacterium]